LKEAIVRFVTTPSNTPDFDFDLGKCTWENVLSELEKAQTAVSQNEIDGKKFPHKAFRALGNIGGDFMTKGMPSVPDAMSVLHGGLAVIYSVS
jgi:hypothetical protein